MRSIDLIRDNLIRSRDRVLARVEEMGDHSLVFPTPSGGGHTLWVLGHLAYIESLVTRGYMLGEPNPLAAWEKPFDELEPTGDQSRYPPFAEVLAACCESPLSSFSRRSPRVISTGRAGTLRRVSTRCSVPTGRVCSSSPTTGTCTAAS